MDLYLESVPISDPKCARTLDAQDKEMKPSTHLQLPPRDDNEENDDKDDCAAAMSPVNGGDWCVGSRVERELDGLWFPATIVARDADGLFEIEYDEDHNREMYISEEELRYERTCWFCCLFMV